MRWSLETIDNFDFGTIPLVYVYVAPVIVPPEDIRTVDLQGAHVMLDVDGAGNVTGIEILGPAVHTDLTRLGEYLMEPPAERNGNGQD